MVRMSLLAPVVSVVVSMGSAGAASTQPSQTALLPPELPWDGASAALALPSDHRWATPAERSAFETTPRYAETMDWLSALAGQAPQLRMLSIGRSAEGREIRMVVASKEGAADAAALRSNGRPILLAQAGIHSGEIDGKDAGLMLLRDMTVLGRATELLEQANLLFVPILSVDAHERFSRFGRINQRGPSEMGWRTNARNLNLNRDYTKLETEELRALFAVVLDWKPDLYLDLHVTDGADYQYDITYGYNGRHAWSPHIARWLDETLSPAFDADLGRAGHVPGPLIFATNGRDMSEGNVIWTASPRFSNGWGDARHLPTVLVENHSLKPYRQRVLGTRVLLESAMRLLGRESGSLRAAVARDVAEAPDQIPLVWEVDREADAEMRPLLAVRSEIALSPVSGAPVVRWTGEPVELEIPFLVMDKPTVSVRRPSSYFIPAAWYPIVEKLRAHGIAVTRLDADTIAEVESYRLPEAALDAARSPFEGRTLYTSGSPTVERREANFRTGSFRVDTAQPLGTLAVLLLEPQCPDSLFAWGYFAEVLRRAEYFEGYVIEPMARAMLEDDPDLRAAFQQRLLSDTDFAGSPTARLEWFYERTPFYDERYRLYPVARSPD